MRFLASVRANIATQSVLRYIAKRLLQAVAVVFGVSLMTFSLLYALPGNAAMLILGQDATPSSLRALTLRLGLNQPFFERYGHWLGGVLHGNMGDSLINGQSVASIIGQRFPVTGELVLLAFIFSICFSIPVALLAARRPRRVVDRLSTVTTMMGLSIPPFLLALLFIIVFAVKIHLFPATGYQPLSTGLWHNLKYMILPSLTLACGLSAVYVRLLRADLSDQMVGEDYIIFARSKGVRGWQILVRHALRNSLLPLITVVALNLGVLIGGSVLIETVFALPGMGQELVTAVESRDVTVIQGIVVLLAVAVTTANLLADLIYGFLDPRIRIQGRS